MGFDAKLLQRFDIQVRAITGGTGLVLLVASCINLIVSLLDSFSPKTLILSTYTRYPSRSHLTPRTTLTLTRSLTRVQHRKHHGGAVRAREGVVL